MVLFCPFEKQGKTTAFIFSPFENSGKTLVLAVLTVEAALSDYKLTFVAFIVFRNTYMMYLQFKLCINALFFLLSTSEGSYLPFLSLEFFYIRFCSSGMVYFVQVLE